RGVRREPVAECRATAAEKGGVDERVAGRTQLRDEHVLVGLSGAAVCGLKSPGRNGEVARESVPGHVRAAERVHRDVGAELEIAATEEGGVDRRRACRVELRHES